MKWNPCIAVIFALAWCWCRATCACDVPVFRYALERWQAEPYEVTIFHRGPLSAEASKLVDAVSKFGDGAEALANYQTTVVDVGGALEPPVQELWDEQKKPPLPWLVVRYPRGASDPRGPAIWAGPLDQAAAQMMIDSPQRREVSKRLLAGESAVWVQIESGNKQADDQAAQVLRTELAKLEKSLALPEPRAGEEAAAGAGEMRSTLPLRVAFSTLRIARDDPAERVFVSMLMHSEQDISDTKQPLVFPIFGRGRALWAIVGAGITPQVIGDSANYLIGACSCEVKRQNPGIDLLMAADWDSLLDDRPARDVKLPSLAALVEANSATKTSPSMDVARSASIVTKVEDGNSSSIDGSGNDGSGSALSPLSRNLTILAAIALGTLAVSTLWIFFRGRCCGSGSARLPTDGK